MDPKFEEEFENLKKEWDVFCKSCDKSHCEKFSKLLIEFQERLRNLEL